MDKPSSRRDPSVPSISPSSGAPSRHSASHSSPTSPIVGPIPNAPYHLVEGCIISWRTSDGASPPAVPRDLNSGTATHYYEVPEAGSKPYQKFLEQVGTYVAQRVFGYTDGPYFMEGLPANYTLYCYHSQPESTGKPRTDLYLYGPEKKVFRSVNEFTMHAVWLMGGGPHNPRLCECIRCGPLNSQIKINKINGLPGQHDHNDHHHHK
ncbi:hypothetical protein FRC11_001391 [Ceratobasidium sp. 423]|nr:hypothetical protein FRC11_001391 [Ceratobasidium sp. 423]